MKTADSGVGISGRIRDQSVSNGKSCQGWITDRLQFRTDRADEAADFLLDRVHETVDLARIPLGQQFDAAVGQVPDVSDDVESASHPATGRPESDPLDPAREIDASPFLGHETLPTPFRHATPELAVRPDRKQRRSDRKSTRLNSSHMSISYAVFC